MARVGFTASGLALLLAATCAPRAAESGPPPAGAEALRLSGVVTVGDRPSLAVIESVAGGARMVRVGDTIAGGSQVMAIGRDWVRLSSAGGEWQLRLTSLPAGTSEPIDPRTPVSAGGMPPVGVAGSKVDEGGVPQATGVVKLDSELQEIIAAVAANEANSADALAWAIGAYLGLPSDTEIAVTDLSFGAFDNAAAAKAALDRNGMVRVRIGSEEGGQMRMLYLQVPAPEGSQGKSDTK